ncbi:ATP-grasp domain-containing protein [Cryptosporangium minutisporangium]|uniref:ATP-grasp domain-containing protein n=1 Tax=Cryptosporangium minutisporangium TaxID=113569 RepID=A0ABP6SVW5_9ACTN
MSRRIVLVTATELPGPDVELPVLRAAADRAGLVAEIAAWDDPTVAWDRYDAALIRSTWNYFDKVEQFQDWADAVSGVTRLVNSAATIRWNSVKTYLGDLLAAGVPTVPTTYLPPGEPIPLPRYDDFVVKPTVGGGARGARRFRSADAQEAPEHVAALHAQGFTAMVQPYQKRVDTDGERAIVYFGGEFSHAIVKGPVLSATTGVRDAEPHPNPRPYEPSDAEHAVARAALAAAPEAPLYGRLDLVLDDAGAPIVMEAELIEPHLFLGFAPGADDALMSALKHLPGW